MSTAPAVAVSLIPSHTAAVIPQQCEATNDHHLVRLWLHGRSPRTIRMYKTNSARFFAFVKKPLASVTLGDLQAFSDSLRAAGLAANSEATILTAVKSLLTFAGKLQYVPFNVGAALRLPKCEHSLTERILPRAAVVNIIALEPHPRNRTLLLLLYKSGVRVSEVCGLLWRHVRQHEADDAGQISVYGKGSKHRSIWLNDNALRALADIRGDAGPDDAVFPSRIHGRGISTVQVWRIVRAAARRAGVELPVSPHWLRHAHASHSLDAGAPIHLVQSTLGHASIATTGRYAHCSPKDSSARFIADVLI